VIMAWIAVLVVTFASLYLVHLFLEIMSAPRRRRPLTDDEQLWIKELADVHPEDR